MNGKEAETSWERIRSASDVLKEDFKYFPYILDGIIATTISNGNDEKKTEKMQILKEEMGRIEISVSEYKPWHDGDRFILIKMPTYFSPREGNMNQKEYKMGGKYINSLTLARLILLIDEFERRIAKDEAEILPGEPSSMTHKGLAHTLLKDINKFRTCILDFVTEL